MKSAKNCKIILVAITVLLIAKATIFDEDIHCDQYGFDRYEYLIDSSIINLDRTGG